MLTVQTTFPRPQVALWDGLSAAWRRLTHRWAMARLHRATLEQLATLSDHQLRDIGLEESPYHEGALRDACHLQARLSARSASHLLGAVRPQ